MQYIGLDIGGTKCAASLAIVENGVINILEKHAFPTPAGDPYGTLKTLLGIILPWTKQAKGIGISCGGPLDSQTGVVLSPPNLPGWDGIPVKDYFKEATGLNTSLCNDANACALAEWGYGAGRGADNMIYLTFGTGLGAGLILDGRLYAGTNDMAGEVGHIRMSYQGGTGYGKRGSLESFCSGGGIAQLGCAAIERARKKGKTPYLLQAAGSKENVTAKLIAELAAKGDRLSLGVYQKSGRMLGKGLAILIDLFNPQKIILGGIFMRSGELLMPSMIRELKKEALSRSVEACEILPAGLKENVGDFAAIAIAEVNDDYGN